MTSDRWLRVVDFLLWVGAASTAVVFVCGVPALALGGPPAVKQVLFVVGFLLFGLASLGIQPSRPHRDEQLVTAETDSEADLEARLQDLAPVEERLPYDDRVGRDTKLFVTSLVVLAVSLVMEVGFGVAG
ncbi:MAG: hypothetical protein ABEJ05_08990 [Haloglomus sp.]